MDLTAGKTGMKIRLENDAAYVLTLFQELCHRLSSQCSHYTLIKSASVLPGQDVPGLGSLTEFPGICWTVLSRNAELTKAARIAWPVVCQLQRLHAGKIISCSSAI